MPVFFPVFLPDSVIDGFFCFAEIAALLFGGFIQGFNRSHGSPQVRPPN